MPLWGDGCTTEEGRGITENETTEILELDLGPSGSEAFSTLDEFEKWFATEEEFARGLFRTKLLNAGEVAKNLNPRFEAIHQALAEARNAIGRGEQWRHALRNTAGKIQHLYQEPHALVLQKSPKGRFLQRLFDLAHDEGTAALGYLIGARLDPQAPSTFRGSIAMALFEEGVPSSIEDHRESLEEVIASGKNQVSSLKGLGTRWENRFTQYSEEYQDLLDTTRERFDEISADLERRFSGLYEGTEAKLDAHVKTYEEKLALHSAVVYWETSRKSRRNQTIGSGVFFAAGLAAAAYFLWYFTGQLLTGVITYPKLTAIFLSASPIFWGLRILARILLSNLHLHTDAGERQILIQTYLALHKEGKITEQDRELLLAAIFRPASTGIVREDSVPTWTDLVPKLAGKG